MRSVMYVGLVVASLLGLWCLGHSVPSTIVDCPSINVDCPSNCNYDRYLYRGPVYRCTEVTQNGTTYCCLYVCWEYRCRDRHTPPNDWCGLSQVCRLESVTEARCRYLSGQGWECQ